MLVNTVQVAVVLLAGITWEKWLSAESLLHLSTWVAPLTGGVIAYFIATFIFYWWHRWRHEHNFLWRGFHQIHHQHGRHRNNYGDITWWDMMFGTYENPKEWDSTCGFDDSKEQQLLRMLAYQDIHAEAPPRNNSGIIVP